mmetsp:Transcript_5774/g.14010  ORF Transcript_5774/g.14010 Transcript_5774/m.14010 type:complete len:255 (-) Transcript_5774:416-1180(-)
MQQRFVHRNPLPLFPAQHLPAQPRGVLRHLPQLVLPPIRLHHLEQRLVVVRSLERVLRGEHIEQHHPARPHVHLLPVPIPEHDLGGHVFGGADGGEQRVVGAEDVGEAKVGEDAAVREGFAADEDVAELDVAVHDFLEVEALHAAEDVVQALPGVRLREGAARGGEDVEEGAAGDEVHDDGEGIGAVEDVDGADEVGVRELAHDVDFAHEEFEVGFVGGDFADDLEGVQLARLAVDAFDDLSEGALAKDGTWLD